MLLLGPRWLQGAFLCSLAHVTTAAAARGRWLKASVSPQGLWAGGDMLWPQMTFLCLAREGWCPGPCLHPHRQRGGGGGFSWKGSSGHFSSGAPGAGDVTALRHCSSCAQRAWEARALPEPDVFPHPVGFSPTVGSDSSPQVSTKQLLGHPRTLPEPLVSSLNPEGAYVPVGP